MNEREPIQKLKPARIVLVDDHPVVEFTAGTSGQYRANVIMATCNTNPCYYGVQVYARAGGGGGK